MQNKINCISNDDLVKICDGFYSDDEISREKERFFDAIEKKPQIRRGQDKKSKDLNDILSEMHARDASGDFQPTCVGFELNNIPQSEDGSVPNFQILSTLHAMRSTFVT